MAKTRKKNRKRTAQRQRIILRNKPIVVRDAITLVPTIRINVGEMSDEYIKAIHDDFTRRTAPEGENN